MVDVRHLLSNNKWKRIPIGKFLLVDTLRMWQDVNHFKGMEPFHVTKKQEDFN